MRMLILIKGYWFKIRMEFLRPISAKIKLICQQPTTPQFSGVHPSSGVLQRMPGGSQGGLAMVGGNRGTSNSAMYQIDLASMEPLMDVLYTVQGTMRLPLHQ